MTANKLEEASCFLSAHLPAYNLKLIQAKAPTSELDDYLIWFE